MSKTSFSIRVSSQSSSSNACSSIDFSRISFLLLNLFLGILSTPIIYNKQTNSYFVINWQFYLLSFNYSIWSISVIFNDEPIIVLPINQSLVVFLFGMIIISSGLSSIHSSISQYTTSSFVNVTLTVFVYSHLANVSIVLSLPNAFEIKNVIY